MMIDGLHSEEGVYLCEEDLIELMKTSTVLSQYMCAEHEYQKVWSEVTKVKDNRFYFESVEPNGHTGHGSTYWYIDADCRFKVAQTVLPMRRQDINPDLVTA